MRIRIYLEGGGQTAEGKAQLRQGMDGFLRPLKDRARERSWRWQLVACEGREQTWQAFQHALGEYPDDLNILLVDSEAEVTAPDPKQHLAQRDGWSTAGLDANRIHLMAQCMEAWIVADLDALAGNYGQGFNANALPRRQDLEREPKPAVLNSLKEATRRTQKGAYSKIRHAAAILPKLDSSRVCARCKHAERLFSHLLQELAQ